MSDSSDKRTKPGELREALEPLPGLSLRSRRYSTPLPKLPTMSTTPSKSHAPALDPTDERPESCYCSALPEGSGPCVPCYRRWLRLTLPAHEQDRPHSTSHRFLSFPGTIPVDLRLSIAEIGRHTWLMPL